MKTNKILLSAILASTTALVACGGGGGGGGGGSSTEISQLIKNKEAFDPSGDATCNNIGTQIGTVTKDWEDSVVAATPTTAPLCQISQRIVEDTTLTEDIVWSFSGTIFVGFGDKEIEKESDITLLKNNKVTLTIDAGTEIRSSSGGILVITRGSEIDVNGTSANPVIMQARDELLDGGTVDTAEDIDGNGEWGGLVIQGFAVNNKCPAGEAICNLQSEGNVGKFGGNEDDDSSGSIRYLVLAEGGIEIAPDNEINGVTFMSVGNGTEVDYLQVHNNKDDGVEFFGGQVNVKHLVLTNNGDDSIDWDEGYQGNIQYAIVQNPGDHGIESDSAGPSNDAEPISKPSLMNVTFFTNTGSDDGLRFRRGTGAQMVNVAVIGFPNGGILVEDAETGLQTGGELEFTNVLFDVNGGTLLSTSSNTTTTGSLGISDESLSLDDEFGITSGSGDVTSAVATEAGGTANGFFDATDYVGATDDDVSDDWFSSWTLPGTVIDPSI